MFDAARYLFHNVVVICLVINPTTSTLWNCGNSTFAQDYVNSTYSDVATTIRNYFLTGPGKGSAFNLIAELADRFGPRIVGSQNLENAIDFKVHTRPFQTYKWVRGFESATVVEPAKRNLTILGLGGTVPTPPSGITAEAVVVQSFQELEELGEKVRGKIVMFSRPWRGSYFKTHRLNGASQAAKHGAVAALIRTITPLSINSPHTGYLIYQDGIKKIPAASITVEDAQMLARIQNRHETIIIRLIIESFVTDTNVIMRNVIIDYPGTSESNEVVLASSHIDSWDVGPGAMDDLSGVALNLVTLTAWKALGLHPRRTIRVGLFNAEEQGYVGSAAYYKENRNNPNISHIFVLSSDFGAFKPAGLSITANDTATATMQSIISLLEPIGAARLNKGVFYGDGREFVRNEGVPGGALRDLENYDYYFQFHHSMGDRPRFFKMQDIRPA